MTADDDAPAPADDPIARAADALRDGRLDEAEAAIREARGRDGQPLKLTELELRLLRLQGRDAEGRRIAETLLRDRPDDWSAYRVAGRFHAACGRQALALEVLDQGLSRWPDNVHLLRAARDAARTGGASDAEIGYLQRLLAAGYAPSDCLAAIGRVHLENHRAEAAMESFAAALEAGADEAGLALWRARAAREMGDVDLAESLLAGPAAAQPDGDAAALLRKLRAASRAPRVEMRRLDAEALFALARSGGWRDRQPFVAVTEAGDMLLHLRAGTRGVVLVFGGLSMMMGSLSLNLDRLAERTDVSVIYLSDPRRLMLLQGLPSLGEDYPASLAQLKTLIGLLGFDRVYALGNSGGGYPSIRYGIDLGAEAILALSPATTMEDPRQVGPMGLRLRGQLDPAMCADLRDHMLETGYRGRLLCYYPKGEPSDAAQAERLAGLANVSLRPVELASHHIREHLKATGEYDRAIDEMLAQPEPD